jgi:hypothetical protein
LNGSYLFMDLSYYFLKIIVRLLLHLRNTTCVTVSIILRGRCKFLYKETLNTKYHTHWELSITIVLDRQQHTGDSKALKEHIVIDFAERKLSQCTSITEIKVEETIRRLCVICIITLIRQNSFSLYKNLQRPLKIIDTVTQVVFLKVAFLSEHVQGITLERTNEKFTI